MRLIRDGARRDLRVDFFRGLALWWIYTDHIPGDALGRWSLRNFALCDATEVFVLLAGYGAGLAYGGVMRRRGWLHGAAGCVRRAWTLYIAHIFLFVVFSAQVGFSAAALSRADYLDESKLDVLADQPYQALLHALTLHYQPSLLNILPLYVVLLLMFALALPLLTRPVLLWSLSIGLYAAARLFHLNLPSWTGGGWFFDPFSWQLLFVAGALLAYHAVPLPARKRPLDIAAVLLVLFGLAVIYGAESRAWFDFWIPLPLLHWLLSIDKTTLDPLRLTSIAALCWLVARLVPQQARWLRSWPASPFVLAGQHSLPVFCWGIFIGFFGRTALDRGGGPLMQLLVNLGGGLAMAGVAAVAAWYQLPDPTGRRGELTEARAE
ncbi:MAG TPA: OpgC domain-containing protein [Acetobacteraceae bacterium]|nr:OpgC domain-containing protein [Acetobacteraceae bacterium]